MNNSFSITKIIGGLSKTLNVVNQLIPLYNQAKPYLGKANKMLSNINNFSLYQQKPNKTQSNPIQQSTPKNNNLPTFFQ
jgi:hypothetical protein